MVCAMPLSRARARAQMVGGIFVTIRAMVAQAGGAECHVNKTNSILGLTMCVRARRPKTEEMGEKEVSTVQKGFRRESQASPSAVS